VWELFLAAAGQYGLPVGLLLVAVVILGRVVTVQYREKQASDAKRITELTAEVQFYRERWLEELEKSEVGTEGLHRLAGGRRRAGGTR
jgi:hypothetical protein